MAKAAARVKPQPEPEVAAAHASAGETKTEKKLKAEKEPKFLATVKASAMSVDVGPTVIAGLSRSYDEENKARALLQSVESKRFDLLAMTTEAVVKAAKADTSINLAATFNGDAKAMNLLNDQLGLALGFREVTTVKVGDKEVSKIGYAKSVLKYFPGAKDDKKSPEYTRKATMRSNFLHMLKKCAQAASAIVDKDIKVTKDSASGTLMLSGPAIQQQFGSDSVLLNDKLKVRDGEGEKTLKEKPSFTAIAKMGAEAAGKTLQKRADSRVSNTAVDPDVSIQSIANTFVQALGKLKTHPNPKTVESLKAVQSAIDKALKS